MRLDWPSDSGLRVAAVTSDTIVAAASKPHPPPPIICISAIRSICALQARICERLSRTKSCTCIYIHTHIYIYIYIYMYMCVCVYISSYINICMYVVYIYHIYHIYTIRSIHARIRSHERNRLIASRLIFISFRAYEA